MEYQRPKYVEIAWDVRDRAIERIQDKYKLYLSEIGGGMYREVTQIDLGFDHYGRLSKDELRAMVVDATEILLEEINQSEEIRPYLNHYPFGPTDVAVNIYVLDKTPPMHPDIRVVSTMHGHIDYCTYSPEKECGCYQRVQEPYAEALAIVKAQTTEPGTTATP